jgi:hypothetical protein
MTITLCFAVLLYNKYVPYNDKETKHYNPKQEKTLLVKKIKHYNPKQDLSRSQNITIKNKKNILYNKYVPYNDIVDQ